MLNISLSDTVIQRIELVLFFIELFAFSVKFYLLVFLLDKARNSSKILKPMVCLFAILLGSIFVDLSWIVPLIKILFLSDTWRPIALFFIRIGWAFHLIVGQALGLFTILLGEKDYKFNAYQKIILLLNSIFIAYFIYIAFFHIHLIGANRTVTEIQMINFCSTYWFQLLIIPSLFFTVKKIKISTFPKLLKKQVTVLLTYLIFPYTFVQSVESFFVWHNVQALIAACISTPLLTIAIWYCIHRIMGYRFLNFQKQVQASEKFDFITDFNWFLEGLGNVANINEIQHFIQGFFKSSFAIPLNKTEFYARKSQFVYSNKQDAPPLNAKEIIVENALVVHENLVTILKKNTVLIKDEIVFSNFYQESVEYQIMLDLLDTLKADVFLPIFEGDAFVGYIIIESGARPNRFFSDVEHDEFVLVARHLGKVINMLRYSSLDVVLEREKMLNEEVYYLHKQILLYQESISAFMRNDKQRRIGVLFYKWDRKFSFANQAAKDFITINVNMHEGHPLTKTLRNLVHNVETYKVAQTAFSYDAQGNRLVLAGIPNLERNNTIILVYYPEISDILKSQLDKIGCHSDWHYVLCLETTKSGQLINEMVPGTGQSLMRFKIDLLRMAMGKKTLLLDMPADDLLSTAEIIHYISLRKELYHLSVRPESVTSQVIIKLFGINPLYGAFPTPLFEQLESGTLFIENIHLLDIEIQHMLAQYIKYGHYTPYKSSQKIFSSVRIICSARPDLYSLVQAGKFSKDLFEELKETTLTLPSFLQLSENDMNELITNFTEQAVATSPLKNLLELSYSEKTKILMNRPMSLQAFKNKIKNALVKKSQKKEMYHEITFESGYTISDPELAQAAKMGKKALGDAKMLSMLITKLKSQSSVADFLGVNRSTIHRRVKQAKVDQ